MRHTHKIAGRWLALCALGVCGINMLPGLQFKADAAEPMRHMTIAQIVADMGQGINLGNTFEACGDWIDSSSITNYETAWGSPAISQMCSPLGRLNHIQNQAIRSRLLTM